MSRVATRGGPIGLVIDARSPVAAWLAVVAAASGLGLSAAVTTPPVALYAVLGVAAVGAVLIHPWLVAPLLLLFSGLTARMGGHLLIPGVGLPIPETVLVVGLLATFAGTLASPVTNERRAAAVVLPWVPAAVWGCGLLVLNNHGDLTSGARDAAIFVYPLLLSLPLTRVTPCAVRNFIDGPAVWWLLSLVLVVDLIGAYNLSVGNVSPLVTGQTRVLSGEYSAPLAAGFLFAIYKLFRTTRHAAASYTLLSAAIVGLALVNHRSAYLAIPVAALVLVLGSRRREGRHSGRPRLPLARLCAAAMIVAVMLLITPVGRQAVDRAVSLGQSNDQTVAFRESAIHLALETPGTVEAMFGEGLGRQATALQSATTYDNAPTFSPDRTEPHNGFVSLYDRGGLLGLSLLAVPMLWGLRRMFLGRHSPPMSVFLGLATFGILMACFNVVLENLFFGVWLWVPLLLGTQLALESDSGRHDPWPSPGG